MAIAGSLEIQLLANVARLSQDMGKAQTMVGTSMKNIEASVASAKAALGALGLGLSLVGFANMVKGSIDAMDKLNDLSKSTGLTVEQLAGLKLLSKQTGTDLDGMAKAINRMSVEMGKSPASFRALGVTATDSIGAFKQLADIFNSLPDINQRNALANKIFGKSWADMAPALAEGGQKIGEVIALGTRLSGVTTDMARQADELNDKWAALGGTGGFLTRMVAPMLPILNALADEMLKVQENTLETTSSFNPLAEMLRVMVILGGNVAFVLKGIGTELGGMAAQVAALARGDFKGFSAIGEMMKADAIKARAAFDLWEKNILNAGKGGLSVTTPAVAVVPGASGKAANFIGGGTGDAEKATKAAADLLAVQKKFRDESEHEMAEMYSKQMIASAEAAAALIADARASSLAIGDMIAELSAMNDADRAATIVKNTAAAEAAVAKMESLKQSLMTEDELRKFSYEADFNQLQADLDNKLIAQETYYTLMGRLIKRNEDEQAKIMGGGYEARRKFAALTMMGQTKDVLGYMADITAGVSQHNRAMFEINKVAGIANAIISAYEGISLTLSKYPYPYNIALAALHGAAAFAQVQAIASTTFGAGGGTPSLAGGTSAPPVTPVEGGVPPGQGGGQTTIINLHGETYNRKQVKALVEQINENTADGGRIVVA